MRIFDIVGDFDQKIKLFNVDEDFIKIWKYGECVCIIKKVSHLEIENCYVIHPDVENAYADTWDIFDCHGGITYQGRFDIGGMFEEEFALGFDYGHLGDYSKFEPQGRYTPLNDKIKETEYLAEQIQDHIRTL